MVTAQLFRRQQVECKIKGSTPSGGNFRNGAADKAAVFLPRDGGHVNVLPADEQRKIFKIRTSSHPLTRSRAEFRNAELLRQRVQAALLCLGRKDVDQLGGAGRIGVEVAAHVEAILPRARVSSASISGIYLPQ